MSGPYRTPGEIPPCQHRRFRSAERLPGIIVWSCRDCGHVPGFWAHYKLDFYAAAIGLSEPDAIFVKMLRRWAKADDGGLTLARDSERDRSPRGE